jgi:isopentenyldiphosphate isomerase
VAAEEILGVVDDDGREVGSAPRWQVRRDNLRHRATAVLVRNSAGEIYVHRRTDDKDVYPGAHDVWAGGCVLAGEPVAAAAVRELAEELGISGVPLTPVDVFDYADGTTRYQAHCLEARWDGPIVHQPEEVAWGAWMSLDDLRAHLADPDWPFVPDGRVGITRWFARNG